MKIFSGSGDIICRLIQIMDNAGMSSVKKSINLFDLNFKVFNVKFDYIE